MLPILLFLVNKNLVKKAPGGSALGDFIAVNFMALRKAGIRGFGRAGYWERAMPRNLPPGTVRWNDQFVSTSCSASLSASYTVHKINSSIRLKMSVAQ